MKTQFPTCRPRRLRQTRNIRGMVRETLLSPFDLIAPIFVVHGKSVRREIPSMPDIFHFSVDMLAEEIEELAELKIPAVILFGIPQEKDPVGKENFAEDGIVQQAIRVIKDVVPEFIVITDVCLCEYTDHGHCGLLPDKDVQNNSMDGFDSGSQNIEILNDQTLPVLSKVAVSHANAGADIVAPSGMMDGMVGSIRNSLDAEGFKNVSILSYSAKYASAFYGPFRDAAESAPQFGDRQTYQMDPANAREAIREVALDIQEGADIVMVKPALPYLDILRQIRDRFDHPLAAYNVSGEYAMIKAAAQKGWLDERKTALESLLSIKRAGADMIISYWAKSASKWLEENYA